MGVLNEYCVITHTGKLLVVLSWENFCILFWPRQYLMLIHMVIHLLSKQRNIELLTLRVQHIQGKSDLYCCRS